MDARCRHVSLSRRQSELRRKCSGHAICVLQPAAHGQICKLCTHYKNSTTYCYFSTLRLAHKSLDSHALPLLLETLLAVDQDIRTCRPCWSIPLFLSDFNQNSNVSTNHNTTPNFRFCTFPRVLERVCTRGQTEECAFRVFWNFSRRCATYWASNEPTGEVSLSLISSLRI